MNKTREQQLEDALEVCLKRIKELEDLMLMLCGSVRSDVRIVENAERILDYIPIMDTCRK